MSSEGTETAGGGGGAKKDIPEEQVIGKTAFEALERDFQEVLRELAGDESLERFRLEYEKLHRALQKSRDSERRLIKKCQELNAEIVSNAAKVHTALKLSQEDQQTIQSLRKEIEKAWKMADIAHEKEQKAKETIQQLKAEISNLSQLVDQGAGLTVGQENTVNELLRVKDELTKERDAQNTTIAGLRKEVQDYRDKIRSMEEEKSSLQSELGKLKESIDLKKKEHEREAKRKERAEKELVEVKNALESRMQEVRDKDDTIQHNIKAISQLELQLQDQKQKTETTRKDLDELTMKLEKTEEDLKQKIAYTSQLQALNAVHQADLKVKEDEINSVRQEAQKLVKVCENFKKKVDQLETAKKEVEESKEGMRMEMENLQKDLDKMKKDAELDKRNIEELTREKEILYKNLVKSQTGTAEQESLVKATETHVRNLEHEIYGYKMEAQNLKKQIHDLEKKRDKYAQESSLSTQKHLEALEEVKMRDMKILEAQKKIAEAETKLKNQQALYETVRSDRNLYSKNLLEAQDEIAEMKRKFKIMNHQIDQLKEEIASKERALVEEHFSAQKIEKEKEALVNEVTKLKQAIEKANSTMENYRQEINNLNQIIAQAEQERLRQKKEFDIVIKERDILGTQLIRRNDELALLYEKIRIQQSTLNKGEVQYRDRLVDIRVLKLKINELKRELYILRSSVSNIDKLRKEVHHLQRELLQERTKVKALSEELENPMNVHRWRKLEGSDPNAFEMIQKIQTLQKRLIAKTEEVVEKDLLIQEKEKLYVELKNILARQPGPEVAEQLNVYQQNLKEKTQQMKSMASELNMFQAQVNEYKYEIERLTRELQDVKKNYYEQKRREHLQREKERGAPPDSIPVKHQNQTRYTGGGFSLSTGN